jgi:uncharacterized membrane protein YqgA involved in biofilm formation
VISGTILNVAAILAGGTLGSLFGAVLPARFQQIMVQALGLSVLLIGTQMALKTTNVLFPLLGILFGGLIGIEAALERLGEWFQRRLSSRAGAVAQGFVTASLVFVSARSPSWAPSRTVSPATFVCWPSKAF